MQNFSSFDIKKNKEIEEILNNLFTKLTPEDSQNKLKEFVDDFRKSLEFDSELIFKLNLNPIEKNKDINEFLRNQNSLLLENSKEFLIGIGSTSEDIKRNHILFKTPFLKYVYFGFFFFFRRFIPKLFLLRKIPLINRIRVYSKAEIMGRMIYNGFKILQFEKLNSQSHFFVIQRINCPQNIKVQEGLIISLNRIGKKGKHIKLYKIRTMHPYSEYLHEFMINKYGFNEKGKISEDFRTAGWGKFLRKLWIDEIPQLINLFKGDLKLFGIRPVSQSYLNTLDDEYKKIRFNQKPGCIPPYLVFSKDSKKESVLKAEHQYIETIKNKSFIGTFFLDFKYTLISILNIVFKGRRSS